MGVVKGAQTHSSASTDLTAIPSMQFYSFIYLQAKLVKYRDEAVEGGDLVEQLTAQAKADHQNIRHLQGEVEEHQQQFQTQQVSLNIDQLNIFFLDLSLVI